MRTLRVLVVESDPSLRCLIEIILDREGCIVATAPDSSVALDLLRSDLPDLLLLDPMPGTSGFDVLERIEKANDPWLRHVIVLTSASPAVIAGLTTKHTICHVLRKPFDIRELVGGIQSCAATLGIDRKPSRNALIETRQ